MEAHEELLTVVRNLKVVRRAKHKEEKKEEDRLEKLKLRLRIKLDHDRKVANGPPITKTA